MGHSHMVLILVERIPKLIVKFVKTEMKVEPLEAYKYIIVLLHILIFFQ